MKAHFVGGIMAALLVSCSPRPKTAMVTYEQPLTTAYHFPLVSPGTKFATLPPAVQHAVRAETGAAEIEDIIKDTNGPQTVYRVYFANRDAFPPLYVAPDGSVLNENLTVAMGAARDQFGVLVGGPTSKLTLNDLPAKVVKTIQAEAPDAEIDTITKETRGDQAVYVVSFKGRRHADLSLSSEGVVLPEVKIIRSPK